MWDVLSEFATRAIKLLAAPGDSCARRLDPKGVTQSLKEMLLAMPNAGEDRTLSGTKMTGRAVEH